MIRQVLSPLENPSSPAVWKTVICLAGLSTSRTGTGLAVVFATLTFGVLTTLTFVGDGGDGTPCVAGKTAKQASAKREIAVNMIFRLFINYFSFHQGSNEVPEPSSEIIFGTFSRRLKRPPRTLQGSAALSCMRDDF
jgi:hypothetical protein